jgi:hypothetical protein
MERVLIRMITQAARAGTEFAVVNDQVLVRGTPPPADLASMRDDVRALLLDDHCVACGAPSWIREQDTAIPWCRPCAQRRGTQLLRAERPDLMPAASPVRPDAAWEVRCAR